MKWFAVTAVFIAAMFAVPNIAHTATRSLFTPEELAWIAAHPTVRYANNFDLKPVEYVEGRQLKGLVAGYLDAVTKVSGLKFERYVTSTWAESQQAFIEGKVDLLPNVGDQRVLPAAIAEMNMTQSYLSATTIIVSVADSPIIVSIRDLNGKRLAVRRDGFFVKFIARNYPQIIPIETTSPEESLDAVVSGKAYAAIGTDITLPPLMRRKYPMELGISGVFADMHVAVYMGVRRDDALLLSILGKSLGSLSALQTDLIYDHWVEHADYGSPSVLSILKYRRREIAIVLLFLTALITLLFRARAASRRAIASEAWKSRFLAMTSHEIRTPIHAVLASLELLSLTEMTERQHFLAKTASTAGLSLVNLLTDILDLSKAEAGRLIVENLPTDIGQLMRETSDVVQSSVDEKSLRLVTRIDVLPSRVIMIDPMRFRQIALNLLSNAVKFTEQGSVEVMVTVRTIEDADKARLTLLVADSGIGIEAARQAQLFNAYTQADTNITRRYGGTGLGLAITKELVTLMGGSITLQSEIGVGTRVECTFDVDTADTDAVSTRSLAVTGGEPTPLEPISPALRGMTILVVDDHPVNREIICQQLRSLGAKAVDCASGESAIWMVRAATYSLVLTDCQMPELSGYDTTRRIRAAEPAAGRRMPIIGLSSATDAAHFKECADCGMDGVLKKPISIKELSAALGHWAPAASVEGTPDAPTLAANTALAMRYVNSLFDDALRIESAIDSGDFSAAANIGHRIKGASLVMKAHGVVEIADAIEAGAKADKPDRRWLSQQLGELRTAISQWRDVNVGP